MKPSPFLLGAGLLFWGWQAGFPLVGGLMAIAIESPRWIHVRWELSDEDFRRIWVFSTLLLLGATVYAFSLSDGPGNFRVLFQSPNLRTERNAGTTTARTMALTMRWLPMIFFVFIGAQLFSVRQKIPLHTISTLVRRRWKKAQRLGQPWPPDRSVNISYPYLALCILGAAAHAADDTKFFWGLCALLAWTLWGGRPWRYGLAVWACALAVAIVLGYFGQSSLGRVQRYFEKFDPQWLTELFRKGTDPFQTKTALGQIGRIKLSSKIMIRVQPITTNPVPTLLREASYRNYKAQTWYAGDSRNDFENVLEETNRGTWILLRQKTNTAAVNLACYLPGGKALLPLPSGSGRLEHLFAYLLSRNSAGAVLVQGPGLVMFDARFGPGQTIDYPPDPKDDLVVNPREADALSRVIAELGLTGQNTQQAMRALNTFFQSKFTYRMWQDEPGSDGRAANDDTPLSRFLLQTRSGHCEYFATATVLLLRQLGIPARYAVGYAIHEPSGEGYVVRQRDAHAWCLVWDAESGLWRDFDTTPASWVEAEETRTSPYQALSDFWSRIRFELAKLRWGQTRLRQFILWGLIPVLGLLFYQIIRRFRGKRGRNGRKSSVENLTWPGLDSEFYQLERKLVQRGVSREPGEALSSWLPRAIAEPGLFEIRQPLQQLLLLHYRYRFDPLGLSQSDRDALRREANICLARLKQATTSQG
jgi:transglutaminase-like putative cysteine protease